MSFTVVPLEITAFSLDVSSPTVTRHLLPAPVLPVGCLYNDLRAIWNVNMSSTGTINPADTIGVKVTTLSGVVQERIYNIITVSGVAVGLDDGSGYPHLSNAAIAAINEAVVAGTNLPIEITFYPFSMMSTAVITFSTANPGGITTIFASFGFYRATPNLNLYDNFYYPGVPGHTISGGRVFVEVQGSFGGTITLGTTVDVTVNGTLYTATTTSVGVTHGTEILYIDVPSPGVGSTGGYFTFSAAVAGGFGAVASVIHWDIAFYLESVIIPVTYPGTFTVPSGIYNDAETVAFDTNGGINFTPPSGGVIPASVVYSGTFGSWNWGRWGFTAGVTTSAITYTTTSAGFGASGNTYIILAGIALTSPVFSLADGYMGVVSIIWIKQNDDLMISSNRSAMAHVGHSTVGWDMPYLLYHFVTEAGLSYLANGLLLLETNGSGSSKGYLNNAFGVNGSWNSGVTIAAPNCQPGSKKRSRTTVIRLTGSDVEIDFDYSTQGNFSGATSVAGVPSDIQRCGFADFGAVQALLLTHGTTVCYRSKDGGITWTSAAISAITGTVCSGVMLPSYTFLALVYDTTAMTCKAARSRDTGITWEQDSAAIPQIPALAYPPCLVSLTQGVLAIWILSDQPHFAFSSDEGRTWT
jgi:hypothetical protein